MKFAIRTLSAAIILATAAPVLALTLEERIAKGFEVAADRNAGNCFACHAAEGAELAGNGGPPFIMMQMRFPDREVLKTQIADPRIRNPNTNMPPYGAHDILTEQELEWVVDYVHSL